MTLPKKSNYNQFGGDLLDKNPPENFHNPDATDLPAEDFNQCRASLAGMSQVGCQAYTKVDLSNGAGVFEYETVWDKDLTPMYGWSSIDVGQYTITFPATVTDYQGKKQALNLVGACINPDCINDSGAYNATIQKVGPNSFNVYMFAFGQFNDNATPLDIFFF